MKGRIIIIHIVKLIIVFCGLISIFVVITPGCKKNRQYDLPVRGNVLNKCTDKGFPNVLVQLSYDKQLFSQYTDFNGDFDFGRVPLDSKKKDGFRLGLPRVETDSFELHGIIVTLYDDDIGIYHQFSTTASFNVLNIVMSHTYNETIGDSMRLYFTQRILKKNIPENITELSFIGPIRPINYETWTNYLDYRRGYSMGMWHIDGALKKNGMWKPFEDSIYLGMGATVTYTIPW